MIERLIILGVGLIGGSLALAAKQRGLVKEVIGYGRHEANLQKALSLGVIDTYALDLEAALNKPGLVFLGTPLGAMPKLFAQMRPYLNEHFIITDGGSAKVCVLRAAEEHLGPWYPYFIGGHPIAGREHSGVEAALADLYDKKKVLLTPGRHTLNHVVASVSRLWEGLGSEVSLMDAAYHDNVLAATSHLPHILAYSLVDLLNEHPELGNVFHYTAGGFRDFTRIASSDPTMWRDIALNNRTAIVNWLKEYQAQVGEYIQLIEAGDGEGLFDHFTQAKSARDKHIVRKK